MAPDSPAPADQRIEEIRRHYAELNAISADHAFDPDGQHILAACDALRIERDNLATVLSSAFDDIVPLRAEGKRLAAERDTIAADLSKVMADRDRWLATAREYEAAIGVLAPENDRVGGENERLRAERDALAAQVQRVRDLHSPVDDEVLDWPCYQDKCDHQVECPPIKVRVCGACDEIRAQANEEGEVQLWPCSTMVALW